MEEVVRGGEMGTDRSGPRIQVYSQRALQSSAHYFPSSLPGREKVRKGKDIWRDRKRADS